MDAQATILSAVVSTAAASLVSWLICSRTLRANERQELRDRIAQLNALTIQYPELEDDVYAQAWPPADRATGKALRYENYCCLVFNLVQSLHEHFDGDSENIRRFFGVREMVQRHARWWLTDREKNVEGYLDLRFQKFIEAQIPKELMRKK